jgi:branched-chain amino acid transport system substrate-binding protein
MNRRSAPAGCRHGGAAHDATPAGRGIRVRLVDPADDGTRASTGKQIKAAVDCICEHGNTVAGKKIEVILKDDAAVPTASVAQGLIVNGSVAVVAGFGITPTALAVAPLATEAKVVELVMAAGTSIITSARLHRAHQLPLPQSSVSSPAGRPERHQRWLSCPICAGRGCEKSFTERLTAAGGQVVESIKVPLANPLLQHGRRQAGCDLRVRAVRPGHFMKQYARPG